MNQGDYDRALAKALHDNNRLAQIYREHPELFQPGGVADPRREGVSEPTQLFEVPQPETPSLEPPEVAVDPNVIQAHVNQAVYQDAESTSLMRGFWDNKTQLDQLATERTKLQTDIAYRQQKLSDPDWSPDDLRRPQVQSEIAQLQQQLYMNESREDRLQMAQERLNARFEQRKALIQQAITNDLTQRATDEAYTAYERTLEDYEFQRTQVEWPMAINRCIQDSKIPAELVADFKRDAAREFQAAMAADPNLVIRDMYQFLAPVAKQLVATYDKYHRLRSGQYAAGAAARAATPSPATGPGTQAPPTPAQNKSPEDAMAEATHFWKQNAPRLRAR